MAAVAPRAEARAGNNFLWKITDPILDRSIALVQVLDTGTPSGYGVLVIVGTSDLSTQYSVRP